MAEILIESITRHGVEAKAGQTLCSLKTCPRCAQKPPCFKRHAVRKRVLLVFVGVVCRVWSYLTRWRCPLCWKTFTDYPDFALPHKRYTAPFVLERCAAYASDEVRTYREGVRENGMPRSHADADGGMELSPSTVWRWMEMLDSFVAAERRMLDLIKQKDPSTGLFRALAGVRIREGKYRGERRKMLLEGCWRLALADREYIRLFAVSIFTDLGTRCGFR